MLSREILKIHVCMMTMSLQRKIMLSCSRVNCAAVSTTNKTMITCTDGTTMAAHCSSWLEGHAISDDP